MRRRRNPVDPWKLRGVSVVRVYDTRTWDGDLPGVGPVEDGTLRTWHVTDAPDRVLGVIRRRARLMAAYGPRGKHAELGPGLYASGFPGYWMGRSTGKWSFLDGLRGAPLERLVKALDWRVAEDRVSRRITANEEEFATRILTRVREGVYQPGLLTELADLPYGIQFWKPAFLRRLDIEPGGSPRVLEIQARGRFAEVNQSRPPAELLRRLRRSGVDGVFTRSGMGTNPELAVWNVRAIVGAREVPIENPSRRRR